MFFNNDSFIYDNIPLYGILGGIFAVFFVSFSIYWSINELFLE